MSNNNNLLLDENPLVIIPSLALKLGLNEAIFLQQLHYWILRSKSVYLNKRWIYKTTKEWHKELPFLSVRTIERVIHKLKEKNLIVSKKLSSDRDNHTSYYTIDYERLGELTLKSSDNLAEVSDNLAEVSDNLAESYIVKSLTENTQRLPKTTKEKNIKKVSEDLSEGKKIIEKLETSHKSLNPNFALKAREKSIIEANRLITIDKYEASVIISVIEWIFNSKKGAFWIANIQSGQKLREKFQQLFIQFKNDKKTISGISATKIHTDYVPDDESEVF
jgi:DNA-binding Lrp family transcriptional regulator